jgi:hypothetical protein
MTPDAQQQEQQREDARIAMGDDWPPSDDDEEDRHTQSRSKRAMSVLRRLRLAGAGGGTGEGRSVYLSELVAVVVVFVGSVLLTSVYGSGVESRVADIVMQLFSGVAVAFQLLCIAVLAQRAPMADALLGIEIVRLAGMTIQDIANQLHAGLPPFAFLSQLSSLHSLDTFSIGLEAAEHLVTTIGSFKANAHLDMLSTVLPHLAHWVFVPVFEIVIDKEGTDPNGFLTQWFQAWNFWGGLFLIVVGAALIGVFATMRRAFVLFELWRSDALAKRKPSQRKPSRAISS